MQGFQKSPRPTPVIHTEPGFCKKQRFKNGRSTPPPAPAKSAPPISRVFRRTKQEVMEANRPRSVSFLSEHDNLVVSSPKYDSSRKELYFDQCFTFLCRLGSGSFGEAYKVQSKEDGQLYAIKKSRQRFKGDSDRKQKLEEVNKLEQIQGHPNCVRFYKAWEERQNLYIQTELCEMSLKDYANQVISLAEQEIWYILVDLLQGVSHLHNNKLVHMDIKPDNLFLGRDGLYKIGDFGLVVELSREISDALEGDPKYMAPELMEGNFTKSADIFSLGVTILELATGIELPTGGHAWQQLRHATWPPGITEGLSEELVRLIRKMMDPDPIRRPTVQELLQLPRVQQVLKERMRRMTVSRVTTFLSYIYAVVLRFFLFISRLFFKPSMNNSNTEGEKSFQKMTLDADSTLPRSSLSSLSTEQEFSTDQSSDEEMDVGWINGAANSPFFKIDNYDYGSSTSPFLTWRPVSESSPHPDRAHESNSLGLDTTPSPPRYRKMSGNTPLSDSSLRTRLFVDSGDPLSRLNLSNISSEMD